jgi:hypothetical protein
MAEITASFGGKNITITYPDDLLGKAEEAFVAIYPSAWEAVIDEKKSTMLTDDQVESEIDLTDEEISELRYNFTVGCILDYVKKTIKQYEVESVIQQTKNTSDENLNQIVVDIEEESSGPEYV